MILKYIEWITEGKVKFKNSSNDKRIISDNFRYSSGRKVVEIFDAAFEKYLPKNSTKILVLGWAGGSVGDSLIKKLKNYSITAIENDENMIEIYNKHFQSEKMNVNLVNDTAENWILNEEGTYDVIIVDVFIDGQIPKNCLTENFIMNLFYKCKKDTMIFWNIKNTEFEKYNFLVETLEKIFKNVIEEKFIKNKFLILKNPLVL